MKTLLVLVVATLIVPTLGVRAEDAPETIKGAFGMLLGSTLKESQVLGTSELTDGTPMYQFEPTSPYRAFQAYYVMITPKTHQIYSIWGIGETETSGKAENERDVLLEILSKKYGKVDEDSFGGVLNGAKSITAGSRQIIVKAGGFSNGEIEIRYYDNDLRDKAEKERIEMEASKVDASGL